MLTFKAEILKNKQKSDGTYNVKIRMTYNREVKRLETNIFVRQEDLTKSFKLKNPKFIQEADAIVRHYQEECTKLQIDINHYILDEIITLLKGEQKSSKWLAEQLGKDRATVSKWVTNTMQPDARNLLRIAEALNIDAGRLLNQKHLKK